jgi:hypothetical protein
VEHEREPLCRLEAFEDHEHCEADRVREQAGVFGSMVASVLTTGSGSQVPVRFSRRDCRALSMSMHTRPTRVVSQPLMLLIEALSERVLLIQASWRASSASVTDPSIR